MKSYLLAIVIVSAFISSKALTNTVNTQSKNNQMKQFSLLVRVPVTYTTEQARATGPLWDKTVEEWKAKGVYILSFAFPGESYTVSGNGKKVKNEAIISNNLRVVSNIVLQAADKDQAIELAKACPILAHGGSVEVRDIPKVLHVISE